MEPRVLLNEELLELTVKRLCFQLIEKHSNFENAVIIGLQPRGVFFAKRIVQELQKLLPESTSIPYGELDTTFHRDDFRRRNAPLVPNKTKIDFLIENKHVVLIDDVLFTGRSIRAGLDALMAFGRPTNVELMVLIDRRFSRHLPIQPDYVGKTIDSIAEERVTVQLKEETGVDEVVLYSVKK